MKLLVVLPLTLPRISDALIAFGHTLLESLSPSLQVVFVMALFPLVMNIVQFCIVDQVIKASIGDEYTEDEGYRRLPTGNLDSEAALDRSSISDSRDFPTKDTQLDSPRYRKSPLIPVQTSTPKHADYGSTGTSPNPSEVDGSVSTWVRMAKRRPSSDTQSDTTTDDHLNAPRANRSDAPSPDSALGRSLASRSMNAANGDDVDGDDDVRSAGNDLRRTSSWSIDSSGKKHEA